MQTIVLCFLMPVVMVHECGIVVAVWFFALLCNIGSASMPGPAQGTWKPPGAAGPPDPPGSIAAAVPPGPASSSSNPWVSMIVAKSKSRSESSPTLTRKITASNAEPNRSAQELVALFNAGFARRSAPKPVQKPRPGSQSVMPAPGAAGQQNVIMPDTAEVEEVIEVGETPWKAAPPALPGDLPAPPLDDTAD